MKVLLVCEGEHEKSGALQALVCRLTARKIEIKIDRVSRINIHIHRGKGQGFFKRAVRWLLEAQKRGFDALILVIDEDGDSQRIRDMTEAQESTLAAIPRALGVAIRTFDAWMLADENALTRVLGFHVQRQPNPETTSDPKAVCRRLLKERDDGLTMKLREMYAAVCDAANLDTLQSRCPKGFAPFAKRVKEILLS